MANVIEAEVVVLGSGPGGYAAAFRAADLGKKVVLVERFDTIGGVCLNVGCIPSKALLHIAKVIDEASHMGKYGVEFGKPKIDVNKVRDWKNQVVHKLTGGLTMMAKQRKVQVVTGTGQFISPTELNVTKCVDVTTIKFKNCVIAAGSEPMQLPFIPKDPRVMDSTTALELQKTDGELLVLGGGIIGLEMATIYRALGTKISIVEMMDQIIPGADKDVVQPLYKHIASQYEAIMLKTSVTKVESKKEGLYVTFEGENAPSENPKRYDQLLVAVGRRPNGKALAADKAGVEVTDRGFIEVNKQMQTNVPHIYAIGDIVGQ